ncbi:hypothetical protein RM572_27745 [Streptomyces sp. DSM 42041]|uniref:ESX secretion-associated protein EspG n=1 Tax=Streptomyces hazeniae TaxID=3075538 RepID=A0ABU2NZY3_9ACTN|nr:hypothetical protein [Streptomyces sp. DSM 42041]MDT0382556.1 hypothetical protein [Streptomyces sp. DSM 42041]
MYDDEDSRRLDAFARRLAGELPGAWQCAAYRAPEHEAELAELHDEVWDTGLIADSLATHALEQAVVLTGEGVQLVVLDRRDGPQSGFLVASLIPRGLPMRAFREVREPRGVSLSVDSVAGAGLVDELLLRYDAALAQVRRNATALARDASWAGSPRPDRVVLNWQPDGSLTTTPGSARAATILAAGGFVREQQTGTYRLHGEDTAEQARAVRETGRQLGEYGITVALQHPADRPAPTASGPAPHSPLSQPAAERHRRR